MIDIKVKLLSQDAVLPTKATAGSSGWDVYATEDLVLSAGQSGVMPLGIAVEVPIGYEIQVRSRSGLASKQGIFVINSPGTVDSDYRGEVKVLLARLANAARSDSYEIKKGDRIAQLVLVPVPECQVLEVEELSPTDRDDGGFGSSGA